MGRRGPQPLKTVPKAADDDPKWCTCGAYLYWCAVAKAYVDSRHNISHINGNVRMAHNIDGAK